MKIILKIVLQEFSSLFTMWASRNIAHEAIVSDLSLLDHNNCSWHRNLFQHGNLAMIDAMFLM